MRHALYDRRPTRLHAGPLLAASALACIVAVANCSKTFTVPGTPETSDGGLLDDAGDAGGTTGDGGNTGRTTGDGGGASDASSYDAAGDSGSTQDSGSSLAASVTFVNATGNVSNLGICVEIEEAASDFTPVNITPDSLSSGAAYWMQWSYVGSSLANDTIVIYGVDLGASSLPANPECATLIGSTGTITSSAPVVRLGVISPGEIANGSGHVIAIEGCIPGSATADPSCGSGYTTSVSNLTMNMFTLDSTTVVDGGIGVQFLLLSSAWQAVHGGGTTASVESPSSAPTAGSVVASGVSLNTLTPQVAHSTSGIATSLFAAGAGSGPNGIVAAGPDAGGIAFPVNPAIEGMTWGELNGQPVRTPTTLWDNGTNWTFILVGDPAVPPMTTEDGGFNMAAPHFVVARNNAANANGQ